MSYDIYTGLLRVFPLNAAPQGIKFSCNFADDELQQLRDSYPIAQIAGSGGDFSRATNLQHWLAENIHHKGNANLAFDTSPKDFLDYAFGKGAENGINCVNLAVLLANCCLALGMTARLVMLMPASPFDGDNHAVVHLYDREQARWVMLDPTINAHFTNAAGDRLGILDMRRHLAHQDDIIFSDATHYNNTEWNADNAAYWRSYYAKNLFYLQTYAVSSRSADNRLITLCPVGFDPRRRRVANIEYQIKIYGDDPDMQRWLAQEKQNEPVLCGVEEFISA